ncbi:MAG TPA: ABC transporter substrate-binding protein [Xanthobacteraceae bacterium]|nr:ABC transporter substrate-binding protein [Xanthobacteraceae bacterium]
MQRPVASILAILAVLFAGAANATDAAIVDAAKKEGGLTLYACDPPQTPLYVERFKQLYPDIRVTTYVAGCWQIFNRHGVERRAKRQAADVFFATEDVMTRLDGEGLLDDYRTPELAYFDAAAAPQGKKYLIVKTLIYGMASNRDFTKGVALPKDWLDYVNPQKAWRDQISYYDPRTSSAAFALLAALHQNFGSDKAGAIYKGLIESRASLAPTTPAGMTKLVSGELPIMFYIMNNHFSGIAGKGAPVDFTLPASGTPKLNFGIGITEGAPHPNAARVFIDFMMRDAQQIIQQNNEYSLRKDVSPPKGMPPLSALKTLPLDIDKALASQSQLLAWWQDITGVK